MTIDTGGITNFHITLRQETVRTWTVEAHAATEAEAVDLAKAGKGLILSDKKHDGPCTALWALPTTFRGQNQPHWPQPPPKEKAVKG